MAKIPAPGTPVRGSRSGSAIMALFDLLGRRWAMGVLWTLSEQGVSTFRELEAACQSISPAVLNTRLQELRTAGLVEKVDGGYAATPIGEEIYQCLLPLSKISRKWARLLRETPAG